MTQEIQFSVRVKVYHTRSPTWNLDCAKAPGFIYPKVGELLLKDRNILACVLSFLDKKEMARTSLVNRVCVQAIPLAKRMLENLEFEEFQGDLRRIYLEFHPLKRQVDLSRLLHFFEAMPEEQIQHRFKHYSRIKKIDISKEAIKQNDVSLLIRLLCRISSSFNQYVLYDGISLHINDGKIIKLSLGKEISIFVNLRMLTKFETRYPDLLMIGFCKNSRVHLEILDRILEKAPRLETLIIPESDWIEDAHLEGIAKRCSSLTTVDFRGHRKFSEKAFLDFIRHNPCLVSIALENTFRISVKGFQEMARLCPGLTSLSVRLCPTFNDECLAALAKYCSQLRYLNVSLCHRVSDNGLVKLRASCTHLSEIVRK